MEPISYFLLGVGATGVLSALSAFIGTGNANKQYSAAPQEVTKLQSRNMGLWHITSGIIRIATAFDPTSKTLYLLSMLTFALVLTHMTTEVFVFRTAYLRAPVILPITISSVGLAYMAYECPFPIELAF